MKNPLLLFMMLISSIQSIAQFSYFENCEEAEKQAKLDSDKGIYKWRIHGLVSYSFSDFQKFYEIYLYSKYNIEISYEGCIVFEEEMCYTKRMDSLMNAKFGESFLELKKVELESIFSTLSDQDKSEILDLNKIYTSNLESEPKFIGNDNLISNYLKSIIQFKEKAETFFDIINLTIDEKGNVIDIEFYERLEFVDKNKFQIYLDEINKIGNWMPGFIYNTKIKSKAHISISG